jgi:hypothetical protein
MTGPISGWESRGGFDPTGNVQDDLRVARDAVGDLREVERVLHDRLGDPESCQDSVAGAAPVEEDHVPGLFAAERDPLGEHPLEHVLVAHGSPQQPDAGFLQLLLEPEVAHHGRDDRATRQRPLAGEAKRFDVEDEVAVEKPSSAVDEQAPVGVSVEGEAEVGLRFEHRGGQPLGMERAALLVDVAPIGLGVTRHDGRAERGEERGRDRRGRAVRAVESEPQTVKRDPRSERLDEELPVLVEEPARDEGLLGARRRQVAVGRAACVPVARISGAT